MSNEYKDWYNDLTEKQKAIYNIVTEYPFLLPRDSKGNIDEDFDYEYLETEIPNGWNKLFLQMCADIKPLLEAQGIINTFYFRQVKEKYNELRCYTNGVEASDVEVVLQKYGYISNFVCVTCGKPAKYETTGYLESFCEDCWDDLKHKKGRTLQFVDTYKVVGFSDGEQYTKTISVKDEWERYLAILK